MTHETPDTPKKKPKPTTTRDAMPFLYPPEEVDDQPDAQPDDVAEQPGPPINPTIQRPLGPANEPPK